MLRVDNRTALKIQGLSAWCDYRCRFPESRSLHPVWNVYAPRHAFLSHDVCIYVLVRLPHSVHIEVYQYCSNVYFLISILFFFLEREREREREIVAGGEEERGGKGERIAMIEIVVNSQLCPLLQTHL